MRQKLLQLALCLINLIRLARTFKTIIATFLTCDNNGCRSRINRVLIADSVFLGIDDKIIEFNSYRCNSGFLRCTVIDITVLFQRNAGDRSRSGKNSHLQRKRIRCSVIGITFHHIIDSVFLRICSLRNRHIKRYFIQGVLQATWDTLLDGTCFDQILSICTICDIIACSLWILIYKLSQRAGLRHDLIRLAHTSEIIIAALLGSDSNGSCSSIDTVCIADGVFFCWNGRFTCLYSYNRLLGSTIIGITVLFQCNVICREGYFLGIDGHIQWKRIRGSVIGIILHLVIDGIILCLCALRNGSRIFFIIQWVFQFTILWLRFIDCTSCDQLLSCTCITEVFYTNRILCQKLFQFALCWCNLKRRTVFFNYIISAFFIIFDIDFCSCSRIDIIPIANLIFFFGDGYVNIINFGGYRYDFRLVLLILFISIAVFIHL